MSEVPLYPQPARALTPAGHLCRSRSWLSPMVGGGRLRLKVHPLNPCTQRKREHSTRILTHLELSILRPGAQTRDPSDFPSDPYAASTRIPDG